jgi:hypothetical protein
MNIREASKSFDKAAKLIKKETNILTKTEIEFRN